MPTGHDVALKAQDAARAVLYAPVAQRAQELEPLPLNLPAAQGEQSPLDEE